jgi:hypothetical protein
MNYDKGRLNNRLFDVLMSFFYCHNDIISTIYHEICQVWGLLLHIGGGTTCHISKNFILLEYIK